ncbi:alpha/beta hydrolase [Pseudonocardia endophytica]|uniref:Acetyl esterase/lipase n=1 Tax=Pseudonocardia endophytica TaxID=401976 RepID=A0A4R1HLV1_PSEEN|nr:alpha/beta hydrolase [Pseudonocardia endophytica]TCK22003.1 acetyl esterase/lipase [Pseudonocardia endophytica]
MTYRFDPELAPWVPLMPTFDISDPAAARAELAELVRQMPPYTPSRPLTVEDRTAHHSDGGPGVPLRIYRPAHRTAPLPALVFLHGGGFVVGSVDGEDARAQEIAADADVVVVAVDYRLAPEHPFPAGVDDSYLALCWLTEHAAEWGVDRARIGVGGGSAGAGLSAAVALLARDRGGPALRMQYLNIPELDDRLDTHSMRLYTDTPIWNRPNAELSWRYYLGGEPATPYAAPARATDLRGLPAAYVDVCEFDPLRDEGIAYAQRLTQAGVSVELHMYPGTFHGSSLVTDAAVSRRMAADGVTAIRRLLHD